MRYYALALIYMMVGMGTAIGIEIHKDKQLEWTERAMHTALWPTAVTAIIVRNLLKSGAK